MEKQITEGNFEYIERIYTELMAAQTAGKLVFAVRTRSEVDLLIPKEKPPYLIRVADHGDRKSLGEADGP